VPDGTRYPWYREAFPVAPPHRQPFQPIETLDALVVMPVAEPLQLPV
jgi:hypothetical protein